MPGVERVGASMRSRTIHVQSNCRLGRYRICIVLEFRHLRYFLALAEELHFGRAARRLAITQPPLSLIIQQLEASVGVRLFDRDSKGVRLTAAGAAFRRSAQTLLARAEQARLQARWAGCTWASSVRCCSAACRTGWLASRPTVPTSRSP